MPVEVPSVMNEFDTAKLSVEIIENPANKTTLGNGFVSTRAKYTAPPRRRYKFGLTEITHAEMQSVMALFDEARGSSKVLTGWISPITDEEIRTRFAVDQALVATYTGKGTVKTWDINNIVLEDV